jgi:hypothetical protein
LLNIVVCYINSTKVHKSWKDPFYYLHLAMQVKMGRGVKIHFIDLRYTTILYLRYAMPPF